MCGITGIWSPSSAQSGEIRAQVQKMNDALVRRGPDDSDCWFDDRAGVAFGHRRLSIVDLSPHGRQPMVSSTGRYTICFNGEVYNAQELREELEQAGVGPRTYRGTSDTEVMLAAIEALGLERALARFLGMFAFALWDREERSLSLVRDRVGVKPLCYAQQGDALLFGSELRALLAFPKFAKDLDRTAFLDYAAFGCVSGTRSIFRGASKVAPGTILKFRSSSEPGVETRYWDAAERMRAALADPFQGDEREAEEELHRLLEDAVRLRMVSDVPLGSFLSGGIDSSIVTALMQRLSSRPVKSYCVGTADANYDESHFAEAVARRLGTEHSTLNVSPSEAYSAILDLPATYDEPFADSSQLPTYLVSKFARREVTVALSGDGGDEVFAGYNRHVWLPKTWAAATLLPQPARAFVAQSLEGNIAGWLERVPASVRARMPLRHPGDKARKVGRLLRASDFDEAYDCVRRLGENVALGEHSRGRLPSVGNETLSLTLWDILGFLPDDVLTKVDRASMAVSLEAREPLLDHRVIEFAWRLPLAMKMDGKRGKRILRRVLSRYLPRDMIDRPKTGFSVPIGSWLRGALRPWAEEMLERARDDQFFDVPRLNSLWARHLSGSTDAGTMIWVVVAFEAWRQATLANS